MGFELLLEDLVNLAVFVLVFDLPAAFFHTSIGIFSAAATTLLVQPISPGRRAR